MKGETCIVFGQRKRRIVARLRIPAPQPVVTTLAESVIDFGITIGWPPG